MGHIYMKVRLSKEKHLIMETTTENEVEDILYPAGGNRLGPVLIGTKEHLWVSKEAEPVLEQLFDDADCDGDGFGDIDWFESADGKCCFAWLGPNKVVWDPKTFGKADRSVEARFRAGEFIKEGDPIA